MRLNLLLGIALALLQLFGDGENDGEQIVEVMSDRSRDLAGEIEPRVARGGCAGQKIADHEKSGGAIVPEKRKGADLNGKKRPVGKNVFGISVDRRPVELRVE